MNSDIHPIRSNEIDRLGVDSQNRLHWDGHEVVTTTRLPWWVNVAVIVAAAGTLGQCTVSLVDVVHKWSAH